MEDQIRQDLKQSMLSKDVTTVSTLRLLLSELKNSAIQKNVEFLSDEDILLVISRELKKRKEAAEGFRKGNREEQAQKEEAEAAVLQKYLPEQISDEELTNIVKEAITEVGASSMSQMGQVISLVRGKVGSQAEGSRISMIVKTKLSS